MSLSPERPEVSLLQRRPSSPVVCHATGFYPDRVVVFWRRDGEELYEHVDHGEVLPNPDGTFQVSVDLDLASVPREDWRRYECVFKLKGIEDILTPLDPALVRTNWGKTGLGGHGVMSVCLSTVLHSLKYFCTASSGVSNFPEFVVVALLDELEFGHYDSNSQTAEPKYAWLYQLARDYPKYLEMETQRALDGQQRLNVYMDDVKKRFNQTGGKFISNVLCYRCALSPNYLEEDTGHFLGSQQRFKADIETLKKRFNQTGGAHIVQMMSCCEWDDEDHTTDGYHQHGYDGEDFIAIKLRLQYLKYFHTKECVDWLKTLLAYGKSTLQRTERPEVSLLQRRPSSPVVCHATGFYPDRVVVFWRRDGEELYEHVDHGEVLPNPDGTFQVSVDLDLASVPREDWRRYECVFKLKGIEDILTPLDPTLVRTNWGKTGPGRDGGVKSDITTPIIIVCVVLLLLAAVAAGVFLYKKRNGSHSSGISEEQNPAPEVQPLTTYLFTQKIGSFYLCRSSNSMEMKALIGLLLLVGCHGVSSVMSVCLSTVLHSLKYFCTMTSGVSNFPEFVAVAMVDELQIGHYDSNSQTAEPKYAWMDQLIRDYPKYQERETQRALDTQQRFKGRIDDLKERFNQTGGAHIYQVMNGCEWDDEDGTTDGYEQHGYDGEDFLVLDLKNLRWIAPVQQAFITKLSWDQRKARLQYLKYYFTKECVDWLKKFLAYGKSTLQRTERPEVSLLQRRPSSPVVCHATGFYPDRVVVFWRRDGEELYEHVDHGEVLPNPDGTFQVSVDLDLTSVPREDWRRYECVFKLKGIEDILAPLDPALVRTNWGKTGPGGDGGVKSYITTPIIIVCVVLLLAAVAAGVFLYKKRNGSAKSRPAGSHCSSGISEEQNPAPEVQPLTT
ncbi:Major histocompatibility complex class I-related gene protein [Merluccius polli]|uniref:Major histocompatibility complex class I-related gene protein n=1 Tax=Merluccius polli TaxID=89951 RepID=A0AA47N827_MERPO|nr:Major histocompatibility complex class I-related gene protein [Merluccius polli]